MSSSKKKLKKKSSESQVKTMAQASVDVKRKDAKAVAQRKKPATSRPLLPGSWQMNLGTFALLAIGTLALYSSDLHLGFFGVDDPDYVVKNPWIHPMNSENVKHILGNPYFANYSPMHLFSYMLDYSVAGSNAFAFHLSSNIWAGIVAGFVFLTSLALTRNRWISIASGLLFAVHPVHVEAVAWISSRKDLVAVAFALPSFLAYLRYRNEAGKKWYVISLLLFLFAVAGKLSVATFPGVFFAHDYFVEKRPWRRSIADKIPFLIAALIIALVAASAQPSMGHRPNAYILSASLLQNLWLLTGFASYVVYRVPPATTQIMFQIGGILFLIAVFIAPFFLGRKLPMIAVLVYWILLGFIPAQVLSFTHPVTDRYIFFPSVAGVILIAWALFYLTKHLSRYSLIAFALTTLLLAGLWTVKTLNYLAEWGDPRSVWQAAMKKSSDPTIPQNLGSYYVGIYQNIADSTQFSAKDLRRLAAVVWKNDKRLPKLDAEITRRQLDGQMHTEFKNQILSLAWDAFQKALQSKGDRVMPALFYNRGLILVERNDLDGAKKEFLAGANEASREGFDEVKNQLTVYCYTDLGIIAYKKSNYEESLKWFRLAEQHQNSAGANWVPTLSRTCKQLENIIASQKKPK